MFEKLSHHTEINRQHCDDLCWSVVFSSTFRFITLMIWFYLVKCFIFVRLCIFAYVQIKKFISRHARPSIRMFDFTKPFEPSLEDGSQWPWHPAVFFFRFFSTLPLQVCKQHYYRSRLTGLIPAFIFLFFISTKSYFAGSFAHTRPPNCAAFIYLFVVKISVRQNFILYISCL